MGYYKATKEWFEENKARLTPLRRKVFRIWLKIMEARRNDS